MALSKEKQQILDSKDISKAVNRIIESASLVNQSYDSIMSEEDSEIRAIKVRAVGAVMDILESDVRGLRNIYERTKNDF